MAKKYIPLFGYIRSYNVSMDKGVSWQKMFLTEQEVDEFERDGYLVQKEEENKCESL